LWLENLIKIILFSFVISIISTKIMHDITEEEEEEEEE